MRVKAESFLSVFVAENPEHSVLPPSSALSPNPLAFPCFLSTLRSAETGILHALH